MNDGAEKWIKALSGLSEQRVKDEIIKPGFTKLGFMLTRSLADEFSESDEDSVHDLGGMEAGFKQRDSFKVTGATLEIKDPTRYGYFVRKGVRPWFSGTLRQALASGKFPGPVVEWAIRKLGVDLRIATFIAYKIMTEGTGLSPTSAIRARWPSGERVFDYPGYVVEEKNKDDIDRIVSGMGDGIPSLLSKLMG